MKHKIIKLKNGGTLIYLKSRINNSSAFEVGFSVGSENDKRKGTAHFLEHTLFKKTINRTNEEVERDRNKIAPLNASTGWDYLVVKFFRTNKLVEKSLNFAYDILMNSVIDDDYIESEKGVIKEELNMTLDEESRDIFSKNFKQAVSNVKFSSDIVGRTAANIDNIKFSEIKAFKDKYFVGNNFVCSTVTSLSLKKVKTLVNEIFVKNIKEVKEYKKPTNCFEKLEVDKPSSLKVYKNSQDKAMVLMTFKLNKSEFDIFEKDYNYTFLARYLSSSQGGLFLKLRNRGLIYRMSVDISSFKNTSLFNVFFETSKDKIKPTLELIKEEIKSIVENKIDDELIQEYKKNLEYFEDEKMPRRINQVCHISLIDFINYGRVFELSKKQKKNLRDGVNSDRVLEVAREIFNKNTEIYVTALGSISKSNVPDLKYFKDNFLIWEQKNEG